MAAVGLTERSHWPERERWHQTICNFLKIMGEKVAPPSLTCQSSERPRSTLSLSAWEKCIEAWPRLFPTARLQILRELHFGEWQQRTQRLGEHLRPLYFATEPPPPPSPSSPSSDDEPTGADLSAYEIERQKTILANQAKVRDARC